MADALDERTIYQFGKETVRGTAVAAAGKWAAERVEINETGQRRVPQLAKGLLTANRGDELATQFGSEIVIPDTDVHYEQLMPIFGPSIKGGVTSVGSDPYTWTYARSLTADPAPDTLTIERRLDDLASQDDIEVAYCLWSEIGFKYVENETLRFNARGFGRKQQSSTLTPALSMPTPELAPSAKSRVAIDADWASLGTGWLVGMTVGWDWRFQTGFMPRMTADARTDLDMTKHILVPSQVKGLLALTLLLDPTTWAAERTAARAQSLRAIRIEVTGSSSRSLKLDGLFKHTKPNLIGVTQQDGQVLSTLEFETSTDGTNLVQAILVNKTNAYAGV